MLARFLLGLTLFASASLASAHPGHHHHTKAEGAILTEESWDDFVPHGKEVDAIYGDVALCNKYLSAIVAEPVATRNANMTVRDVGGCLIDLTENESQSDQLSAFYPHRRKYVWTSRALKSGHEQETVNGVTVSQSFVELTLRSEGTESQPTVELIYRLEQNDRFLTVITRFANTTKAAVTIDLEDDLRADANGEDMLKSPNGKHNLFWIQDTYWGQAYGFEVEGRKVVSQSDARNTVLKYTLDSDSTVLLEPQQTFELKRRIFPGADLVEVKANWHEALGTKAVPVKLTFNSGNGDPIPRANIAIDSDDIPVGNGRANADGEYFCRLIPGKYEIHVAALGIKLTDSDSLVIEVAESDKPQEFNFDFASWKPGKVSAAITDEQGRPIPCKVAFHAKGETPKPYFAPKSAAFGVIDIYYTPNGTFTQQLPAGSYDVIISHGPEYDAVFTELAIAPGATSTLTGKLIRTVDTKGYVSSDFHSHSSPSGDNTGSQLGRVLSLVCENIEFAPCTEHNRIDTYVPHIKALKLEAEVATVSGMELTGSPLPLNHQNAFPLIHKPRTQDGGAPVRDDDPEAQIERLFLWDDRSEKLIQQNHPDIGWLFFDKNGDGKPDEGYERTHGLIDVMEIHPIHLVLHLEPSAEYNGKPYANRVFGWLQLLNQGYRIPGVVNTDAHYNYHESGGLRNWIVSSTDDPAKIDVTEMIHASEEGRLVMSNGPFLEFKVKETVSNESAGPGQDFVAKSKRITASVRVQCPNWIDVDRVFLLVNGRVHKLHDYRRSSHPDKFPAGVVKFDSELELELTEDTHVIAVAVSESTKLGKIMGPLWGGHNPTAISNPVFVDIDGEGFVPNKDTLDHPLPVKFDAKRQ